MERETASLDPLWTPKVELTKRPDTRLVLLQAPTGFGKTALATYWYQRWQHPRYWLSLTQADNLLHQLAVHLSEVLGLAPLTIASASEATLAAALVRQLRQERTAPPQPVGHRRPPPSH